jgi:hypothetical protein
MHEWVSRLQVFPIVIVRPSRKAAATRYAMRAPSWLFDPQNVVGFPRYFADVSDGFIRLDVDVKRVVLVEDDQFESHVVSARGEAIAACLELARARLGLDTAGFDGVVFMILNAAVDAGAKELDEGRMRNAAILDELHTHSFMAHEIAHVIGFEHSFRVEAASPTYPDGEYGSSYCLTSAEGWGNASPAFALAYDVSSGIPASAEFWKRGGPGLSQAAIWVHAPGFVRPSAPDFVAPARPHPFVEVIPPGTELWRGYLRAPSGDGLRLVAVPDMSIDGYITVEYRAPRGWDTAVGAEPGGPSQPGILIQEVRDVAAMPQHGDGYSRPKTRRVVESAVLGSQGPVKEWSNGRVGVRLRWNDDDGAHVLIGTSVRPRSLSVAQHSTRMEVARTRTDQVGTYFGGARCDRRTAVLDRVEYATAITLEVSPTGFAEPKMIYFLNGERIEEGYERDVLLETDVRIPIRLDIGEGSRAQILPVRLRCAAEGGSFTIRSAGAPGSFAITVTVFATDSEGQALTVKRSVVVVDQTLEFPPGIESEQRACSVALRELGENELPPVTLKPGEENFAGSPDWERMSLPERAAVLARLDPRRPLSISELPKYLRSDISGVKTKRAPIR